MYLKKFFLNLLLLENARNFLVFENRMGWLGRGICCQQLLSIGQQLLRTIPAQHCGKVFAFFIVGRDKAILIERAFHDPEFCSPISGPIHLDLHIKLITPEERHGRKGLLLAKNIPLSVL
jgi:hypothetical protein